eukprot:scaffold13097_cov24-Attheya_sp.AAC.1
MCAFEGRVESDIDSLSNQDKEVEYEEVAQNSTAHGPAAMSFGLNKKEKRKRPSWDDSSQELVDFKAINGHMNVPTKSGQLGTW